MVTTKSTHSTHHVDYVFLGLVGVLTLLGLVFLSSASSVVANQKWGDTYYIVKQQFTHGVLPGLILFFIFSKLDYHKLKVWAVPGIIFCALLLIAVFIPGVGFSYGGATRWIHFGSFILQPSELAKLGFVVYLAAWLESKGTDGLRHFTKGFVPFLITSAIILGLIALQPDVGTMSVLAVSAFVVYLVAGANLWHLAALGTGGLGLLWLMVKLEPYRAARLTVFLHPELDPQGIGYHVNQALLAIGSGGWFGLGLGYSRQKYQYLPEVTGDSIFAVVAEELGFVFTLLVLALIVWFIARGLTIARYAPDDFGKYLGVGIMAWIGWQMFINIASMLSLLPLTGVPLPFISAGGTAFATMLAALGIMANISRQAKVTRR